MNAGDPAATGGARPRCELSDPERAALQPRILDDPDFLEQLEGVRRHLAALPVHRWGMPRVVESNAGRSAEVLDGGTWLPAETLVRGDLSPFDAHVAATLVCRALEAWNDAPEAARRSILCTLELGIDSLGRVRVGAVLTPRSRYPAATHANVLGFLEREPSQDRAEVLTWAEQLHLLATGRFAFPVQKLDPARPPFNRPDKAWLDRLPAELRHTVVAALDPDPAKRPRSTKELLERLTPFCAAQGVLDVEVWQRLGARTREIRKRLLGRVLELSVADEPLPSDMEAGVLDSRTDESAYLVLRDWMLSQGWLRGELAALPNQHPVGHNDFDELRLTWRHGWVGGARVTTERGLSRLIRLVEGSSFRFLERVELPGDIDVNDGLVSALVDRARLRNLCTLAAPGPLVPRWLARLRTLPRFERWELVPKNLRLSPTLPYRGPE